MIVYFSGTGNSRYCAEMLAARLDDEAVDSFYFIRDGIAAELHSERPWVFVAPTYGWQLPRIFVGFIRSGYFEGSKKAYFLMTCGGDTGNAADGNRKLCREKDLEYMGTLPVVMPENYIALFDIPGADRCARLISEAAPAVGAASEAVKHGSPFPSLKVTLSDRLKSGMVNDLFYRFAVKDKLFYSTSLCVGCGSCAEACPLGNISLKDGRPVWGGSCTHCMACICGCPESAIEYGNKSAGKRRYLCKPYRD